MIDRRTDERTADSDTSNMIDVQFQQTKELDKRSKLPLSVFLTVNRRSAILIIFFKYDIACGRN